MARNNNGRQLAVIRRKDGESVGLGADIVIAIQKGKDGNMKLAISAPAEMQIDRNRLARHSCLICFRARPECRCRWQGKFNSEQTQH